MGVSFDVAGGFLFLSGAGALLGGVVGVIGAGIGVYADFIMSCDGLD